MKFAGSAGRLLWVLLLPGAVARAQVVLTDNASVSSKHSDHDQEGDDRSFLVVSSDSKTFLKFSLVNLPSSVTGNNISGATLVLYANSVGKPGTIDVYAVLCKSSRCKLASMRSLKPLCSIPTCNGNKVTPNIWARILQDSL
jgi:hypothetical protein